MVRSHRRNSRHSGSSRRASRRSTSMEVLAGVMARVGAEASAHEVMRAGLARSVAALAEEASGRIEACAGPDRTREIEALVPRADVDSARRLLVQAETQA